jgi:hypothetical protein
MTVAALRVWKNEVAFIIHITLPIDFRLTSHSSNPVCFELMHVQSNHQQHIELHLALIMSSVYCNVKLACGMSVSSGVQVSGSDNKS